MGYRVFRASAFAAALVIVVYFITATVGQWPGSWRVFLPIDLVVYFAIGFAAARYLSDWRRAIVVVAVAALVDGILAVGSVALLGVPDISVAQAALAVLPEIALNIVTGTVGAIIGALGRRSAGGTA